VIAWLADEPVTAKLTGSEQGLNDLRICGAQVNAQYRANLAARQEASARAEAAARAKQLSDEQVALVRAQKDAAEAQAQQVAEQTRRQQADADAQRQQGRAGPACARSTRSASARPRPRAKSICAATIRPGRPIRRPATTGPIPTD